MGKALRLLTMNETEGARVRVLKGFLFCEVEICLGAIGFIGLDGVPFF